MLLLTSSLQSVAPQICGSEILPHLIVQSLAHIMCSLWHGLGASYVASLRMLQQAEYTQWQDVCAMQSALKVKIVVEMMPGAVQDPVAQHQKLAKLARLAIRRLGTQRLKQTPAQNSEVLAKSNAVILRYCLLCLCNSLSLCGVSSIVVSGFKLLCSGRERRRVCECIFCHWHAAGPHCPGLAWDGEGLHPQQVS